MPKYKIEYFDRSLQMLRTTTVRAKNKQGAVHKFRNETGRKLYTWIRRD